MKTENTAFQKSRFKKDCTRIPEKKILLHLEAGP